MIKESSIIADYKTYKVTSSVPHKIIDCWYNTSTGIVSHILFLYNRRWRYVDADCESISNAIDRWKKDNKKKQA